MTIELIVMIFDQDGVTSNAWKALHTLRKTSAFGLENAVLVERDADLQAFIQHYKRYPAWKAPLDDTFLILFTKTIFGDSQGDRACDAVSQELDEVFLEGVTKAWEDKHSALLIFIPRESLLDTRRLLDYLSEYSGTLIHTTIPQRIIESIIEGSKSAELGGVNNNEI